MRRTDKGVQRTEKVVRRTEIVLWGHRRFSQLNVTLSVRPILLRGFGVHEKHSWDRVPLGSCWHYVGNTLELFAIFNRDLKVLN